MIKTVKHSALKHKFLILWHVKKNTWNPKGLVDVLNNNNGVMYENQRYTVFSNINMFYGNGEMWYFNYR